MRDQHPTLVSRFAYSTFADNATAGVCNGDGNDGATICVVNSIVTGNKVGVQRVPYTGMTVDNSAIAGNEAVHGSSAPTLNDCVYEGLVFDEKRPYHPASGSSAIGLPRDLTAADLIAEPTSDLDGQPRRALASRRVAGCYAERARGLLLLVR